MIAKHISFELISLTKNACSCIAEGYEMISMLYSFIDATARFRMNSYRARAGLHVELGWI